MSKKALRVEVSKAVQEFVSGGGKIVKCKPAKAKGIVKFAGKHSVFQMGHQKASLNGVSF